MNDLTFAKQLSKENWRAFTEHLDRLQNLAICNPVEWSDKDLHFIRAVMCMVIGDIHIKLEEASA